MVEIVPVAVGRGPLAGLLEQWWVTAVVRDGAEPAARVRIAVQWSPWSHAFTVPRDALDCVDAAWPGQRADELIDAFIHSPAYDTVLDTIRQLAGRHRDRLPHRVEELTNTR